MSARALALLCWGAILACGVMAANSAVTQNWEAFTPWVSLTGCMVLERMRLLRAHAAEVRALEWKREAEAQIRAIFCSIHQRAEREHALRQGDEREWRS